MQPFKKKESEYKGRVANTEAEGREVGAEKDGGTGIARASMKEHISVVLSSQVCSNLYDSLGNKFTHIFWNLLV